MVTEPETLEHTLADAIKHGVSPVHDGPAEVPPTSVPTFGAQVQVPPPAGDSVAGAAMAMFPGADAPQPDVDAAPKALCCAKKERKDDGRPVMRYPESGDGFYPVDLDGVVYDSFNLRIIHERDRTGFEETKDFPIRANSIVAGRYQVLEYPGCSAAGHLAWCNGRRPYVVSTWFPWETHRVCSWAPNVAWERDMGTKAKCQEACHSSDPQR